MHFEILVEDLSGKQALEILIPKIIPGEHSVRIHAYKGIGRIPKNMKDAGDPSKRILLTNLPKLLKGYGRAFEAYSPETRPVVLVVCDLDDRNAKSFLKELGAVLTQCHPQPNARFCLAIEEGEAWFLGDLPAIRSAYPGAKPKAWETYVNDSICGTWEVLADALYPGGQKALARKGWQAVGAEKMRWAEKIPRHMNVDQNASPSFCDFRDVLKSLCDRRHS